MKIGIVGCGKIAEKHLSAYKKMGDVEIAVSDANQELGESVAKSYKVDWISSPDELIKNDEIVAIDVCVPTVHHKDVIDKALDEGKHFFCEKPLCNSLEEAREIKDRVSRSNLVAMVGYLYRFHPAFKLAKDVLEERIIGDPYYAILRLGGRGSHKIWKHQKEHGGGTINEMLVHMLDLIIWYFGDVKSVKNLYNDVILKEREVEGEMITPTAEDVLWLELKASDTKVICESDLVTPSYMNYIEIQGTNGSVWTSILDFFPTIVYCKEPRGVYNQGNNFFEFSRVNLFEKELGSFIESIQSEKNPDMNSIEDSVKIMEIVESIRK